MLDADLPNHRLERQSPTHGHFRPEGGGLADFEAHERVIKNFLGHTTVAVFVHHLPAAAGEQSRVSLRTTGSISTTGLEPKVIEGSQEALGVASELCADRRFLDAALALDFKRLELIGDDDGWRVEVELIGASQVVTAIPPMRRYIRLYPDQRNALLGVFRVMDRMLGHT